MDLQDIWQEHRRFILGVLGGVVVFFIAKATVQNLFGAEAAVRKANVVVGSGRGPFFDKEAGAAAQQRNDWQNPFRHE